MTQKIKVTGYVDPADLPAAFVDLDDRTGLSSRGYEHVTDDWSVGDLEDVEIERVEVND